MKSVKYVPSNEVLKNSQTIRDDYNKFVRNIHIDTSLLSIKRFKVSRKYLKGRGIEIGAFHAPTPLLDGCEADYLDQMSIEDIKKRFPAYEDHYCVYPNVIDNGEVLKSIKDNSYDFLIANHMIEHTENVFKTIQNHLRVLKKNGILYYAIPDKRFTFDKNRDLTTYEHLKTEYFYGPEDFRYNHFYDFVTNVSNLKCEEAISEARRLTDSGLDTHFHVWTSETFIEHIQSAINDKILNIEILEHTHENDIESISVFKKL